jgi:hypothetical protein
MAERGKNAGEPVEAVDKVEEILLVHDREGGEVGPGNPVGGGQRSVEQVQLGGHRKAVEEQQEREAEQVLLYAKIKSRVIENSKRALFRSFF